jgi:hypothetical protein
MLRGMLRWSGGEKQASTGDSAQLRGYIYCAANETQKLAETALTACDLDRLCTVLANLQALAGGLNSPRQDQQDMRSWHDSLSARLAAMRAAEAVHERLPDLGPVEVFISTGLLSEQHHRASA